MSSCRQRRLDLGGILAVGSIERRGPRCSSWRCMASSSGVLPRRFDTALTTFTSTCVSRHHGGAGGHLLHALDERAHARQVAGADGVAHLGRGLHHVGRHAAGIEHGVVDAGIRGHVLAHVVDADVHQLHGVERAAAQMRRGRRVRGAALEGEVDAACWRGSWRRRPD